jgi:hypothetical protein
MIRLFSLAILAGTLAAVPFGADAAPKKGAASLDPVRGAFHRTHKALKLECGGCHSAGNADVLFLRRADVVPAAMPGQVDRKICLGCHTAPSKPAWYGLGRQ